LIFKISWNHGYNRLMVKAWHLKKIPEKHVLANIYYNGSQIVHNRTGNQ